MRSNLAKLPDIYPGYFRCSVYIIIISSNMKLTILIISYWMKLSICVIIYNQTVCQCRWLSYTKRDIDRKEIDNKIFLPWSNLGLCFWSESEGKGRERREWNAWKSSEPCWREKKRVVSREREWMKERGIERKSEQSS